MHAQDPLDTPAPDVDPDALAAGLSEVWGLTGVLTPLHGERDRNFRIDSAQGRFLLKVHNPADGTDVLDLQASALAHLRRVDAGLPVPAVVPTRTGERWAELIGRDGRSSLAWVMTWLDGSHLDPSTMTAARLRWWGRDAARVGRALRGFTHPAAATPLAWDIARLPQLRGWLDAVAPQRRPAVTAVLDRFDAEVAPLLLRLRAQVVHNDLAPTNVLVGPDGRLSGVTDFGDLTHTALVCDLAVTCADLVVETGDLDAVPLVVAGYETVTPLEPEERGLLADLVAARCAATVLITAWRTREQGWAPPIDDDAFALLERMLAIGVAELAARWERPPYATRSTSGLLAARARTFGGQELSYASPLHLVAGDGVWLRSADGQRYLDAYNNVPVLGHSHPAVAAAAAAQLARLNTNSRYLQDAPVALAERLLASVPDRFDRVLFVNSGSEANDLAWRIARHATGGSGGVATSFAYHGITEAIAAFSPESYAGQEPPAHIRLVDPPPGHCEVAAAVDGLAAAGHPVAAMLVDGVFTSDGVQGPSHDWTRAAASAVHAVGGLYVADEVQAGHGRTGEHLWSFCSGRDELPADLVTLGKPMGNGYPIAAVLGPAALVDPFVEGTDYFSTFGGGTAACAAAIAVLDVFEEEDVLRRVSSVGALLLQALGDVTADSDDVVDVRGWGLALAIDLVDPATGEPAPARTRAAIEGMRSRGVLIGSTGPDRSTLKIRPPLVFGPEHVARLGDALAETLRELR
ncbi:aminotransferase class III-fold pyridoxal phosphate-dependent enzyme [Nocardioides piscis]|uniref:Aminotransferase class III-fold pyridoxal phosphate-dependent enzyme n=1 Tax=Nocardioides piscis TaxID=2714938 RepID=A0A6G7YGL5_9ACTN|nr:aminotransferase class III-fold pyridoxal phosphate-dependent enzyme [Nocardioides piscis]QIK75816.1 aminotransferase class III-fold pyridoxal phosphate-dependent enzyme [Nocardioides piscis]